MFLEHLGVQTFIKLTIVASKRKPMMDKLTIVGIAKWLKIVTFCIVLWKSPNYSTYYDDSLSITGYIFEAIMVRYLKFWSPRLSKIILKTSRINSLVKFTSRYELWHIRGAQELETIGIEGLAAIWASFTEPKEKHCYMPVRISAFWNNWFSELIFKKYVLFDLHWFSELIFKKYFLFRKNS